jgi:hypothetical protein
VQVGVEDRDGLQREDLMHQLGQLRPRLECEIHLQRAPGELVQVVHLERPRLSCAGVGLGVLPEVDDQNRDHHHGHHHAAVVDSELARMKLKVKRLPNIH